MSVYFEHWFNRVQVKKIFFIANLVFLVGSHYLLIKAIWRVKMHPLQECILTFFIIQYVILIIF